MFGTCSGNTTTNCHDTCQAAVKRTMEMRQLMEDNQIGLFGRNNSKGETDEVVSKFTALAKEGFVYAPILPNKYGNGPQYTLLQCAVCLGFPKCTNIILQYMKTSKHITIEGFVDTEAWKECMRLAPDKAQCVLVEFMRQESIPISSIIDLNNIWGRKISFVVTVVKAAISQDMDIAPLPEQIINKSFENFEQKQEKLEAIVELMMPVDKYEDVLKQTSAKFTKQVQELTDLRSVIDSHLHPRAPTEPQSKKEALRQARAAIANRDNDIEELERRVAELKSEKAKWVEKAKVIKNELVEETIQNIAEDTKAPGAKDDSVFAEESV